MAGALNKANLDKAVRYFKKNGLKHTFFASLERLYPAPYEADSYQEPDEETCQRQREKEWQSPVKFSILVPAYRTNPLYLTQMLESVLAQTYENWELILADASGDDTVEKQVSAYHDTRIRYVRLSENGGISANSNQGLKWVTGDYTALLDHDDLLTKDALYEMAFLIEEAGKKGIEKWLIYSDEDKCDENAQHFYEVHRKLKFNLDLILSNNYFCHLSVMKTELIKELGFRKEYDGAQDYDLVLRAIAKLLPEEEKIGHVRKILYHWRCHSGSTAANTDSKLYAYEAGRRALDDFALQMGWDAKAEPMKHLGFYRLRYNPDLLSVRKDIGIVGGCLLDERNKICGGIYTYAGTPLYTGLHREFSGYMHRAALRQDAAVVDVRLMKINPDLAAMVLDILGRDASIAADGRVLTDKMPADTDFIALSRKICRTARAVGYRIVWEPEWKEKVK